MPPVLVSQYLLIPVTGLLVGWVTMRWMTNREISRDSIAGMRANRILWLLAVIAVVTMGGMVAARYLTWHSFIYDLGSYDQKAWLVAEQRTPLGMLEQTYKGGVRLSPCGLNRNWGVCHFQPTFLIFGLLYRIWESPLVLLGVQVVVVVSGVVPVFLLARDHFSPVAGTAAATIYLLYPAVQFNGVLDFRPDHLAIPAMLWAYVLARRGYPLAAVGVAGLPGLAKDTLFLNWAFFGLYLALRHRRRMLGGTTLVAGLAVFYVVRFRLLDFGALSEGQFMIGRFFPELSALTAGDPSKVAGDPMGVLLRLIQPHKLLYLDALLLPMAFLPIRAMTELLPAVPSLAISILSVSAEHASIDSQYAASVVGPALAALFMSISTLRTLFGRVVAPVPVLTGLVVLSAFVSFGLGPTPLSLNFWNLMWGGRWHITQYLPDRQHALERAARLIPTDRDVVVVAQNDVNSKRLAHRYDFFAFPNALDRADYVMLDAHRQPYVYWAPDPQRYQALLRGLLVNPAYRLSFDEDGVLLFERSQRLPHRSSGSLASIVRSHPKVGLGESGPGDGSSATQTPSGETIPAMRRQR